MSILQLFVFLLVALNQVAARHFDQQKQSEAAFDEHSSYAEADILADIKHEAKEKQMTSGSECTAITCHKAKDAATEILPEAPHMAVTDNIKLWNGGKVPYILNFDPTEHVYVHDNIMGAISDINEVNCVHFYEATQEIDVLRINIGLDYSSHVGRQGGVQDLTVSSDNSNSGTIMHELMHTLGFGHEHNRPDRDDYIVIDWDNIKEEAKSYFQKYSYGSGLTNNSLEYNYMSLMHATNQRNADIFVDLNKPIITRINGSLDVGQRAFLTDLDKERINRTYRCGICDSAPDSFLFRYPGDCNKYYQCDHHEPVVRECNENLHFNDQAKYCDYPSSAKCTIYYT